MKKLQVLVQHSAYHPCFLRSPVHPFRFQGGSTWEEAVRRYKADYPGESESLIFPDNNGNFPEQEGAA